MALTGRKKQQLDRLENLVKARKVLDFNDKMLLKKLRQEDGAASAGKSIEELAYEKQLNQLRQSQEAALDAEDFTHYEALGVEQKVLEAREKARLAAIKGETFDLSSELKNIQNSWDNNPMNTETYKLENIDLNNTNHEQLTLALKGLNADIESGTAAAVRSGATGFNFRDLLNDEERLQFESDIENAYKEQSPKASAKKVVELKASPVRPKASTPARMAGEPRFVREVKEYLEPWSRRADEDVYWAGMTEQEWKSNVEQMHKELQGTRSVRAEDEVIDRYFPNMPNSERNDMLKGGKKYGPINSQIKVAVPHAYSQEQQFVKGMQLSGKPAEFNNDLNNLATDLRLGNEMIDVQGLSANPQDLRNPLGPQFSIEVMKYVDEEDIREALRASDSTWTLENLQNKIYDIQYRKGKRGGVPGKLLEYRDGYKVQPGKVKDVLMGNVLDRTKMHNLVGGAQKGTFDPILGRGEYALDLNNLRDDIDRRGISNVREFSIYGDGLRYRAPLKTIQQQAKSEGLIERYLDKDVLKSIDDIAINQGLRDVGGTRFHSVLPGIDLDSVRTNVKGEALGAVIGAVTDKDTMHDLGRGDYKSAGTRMAGDALTGGIAGGAIQAAGKAVAPLAAKAVGPTVAGMAGAAVAPAAVAYGLAQVPDAMVAYRGGQQGRTFEEQKAKERSENVSAYKQAFGGTSAGYRAPRVTTPVAKPAPKPEPRKVTWQDRRNFRRGTR